MGKKSNTVPKDMLISWPATGLRLTPPPGDPRASPSLRDSNLSLEVEGTEESFFLPLLHADRIMSRQGGGCGQPFLAASWNCARVAAATTNLGCLQGGSMESHVARQCRLPVRAWARLCLSL